MVAGAVRRYDAHRNGPRRRRVFRSARVTGGRETGLSIGGAQTVKNRRDAGASCTAHGDLDAGAERTAFKRRDGARKCVCVCGRRARPVADHGCLRRGSSALSGRRRKCQLSRPRTDAILENHYARLRGRCCSARSAVAVPGRTACAASCAAARRWTRARRPRPRPCRGPVLAAHTGRAAAHASSGPSFFLFSNPPPARPLGSTPPPRIAFSHARQPSRFVRPRALFLSPF